MKRLQALAGVGLLLSVACGCGSGAAAPLSPQFILDDTKPQPPPLILEQPPAVQDFTPAPVPVAAVTPPPLDPDDDEPETADDDEMDPEPIPPPSELAKPVPEPDKPTPEPGKPTAEPAKPATGGKPATPAPGGTPSPSSSSASASLPGWFGERDKDRDGQVGMHEWPREQLAEFNKYDRNGDGFITSDEVLRIIAKPTTTAVVASAGTPSASNRPAGTPSFFGKPAPFGKPTPPSAGSGGGGEDERLQRFVQDMFLRPYDANKDGKLDAKELEGSRSLRQNWKDHDTNKDNVLDQSELVAYLKSRGPGGPGGGPGAFRGPGGGNDNPEERAKRTLEMLDRNKDGKLQTDELTGGRWSPIPRDRIAEFDLNKDNAIDFKELTVAMEKLRGQQRPGR
jgi:Ca2+-binding EF-hand superfamily protein